MRSLAQRLGAALLALAAPLALAQSSAGWTAYPAFNEASAVAAAPDGLWAASDGGVFFYGLPDGELRTVTAVEGLQGGPVGALVVDAARGALWIGYEDGALDRLDVASGDVDAVFAIARADQYPSRGVRRLRLFGDALYAATDFGVVVLDAATGTVRNAYARIGDLDAGAAINDMVEAPLPGGGPGLWVAAEGGLYVAPLDGTTLQAPGAWIRAPQWVGAAYSLALYRGTLYVGGGPEGARDLYARAASGAWERQIFTDNPLVALAVAADRIVAIAERAVYVNERPGVPTVIYTSGDAIALRDVAVAPDGRAWVADAAVGLFPVPTAGTPGINDFDPEPVVPPGPLSTAITDLDVDDDGTVWLVTERIEAVGYASVSRLDADGWTAFRTDDPGLDIARASLLSMSIGPDGAAYAGSAGDGLTVFSPDGAVTTYRPDNSTLLPAAGTSDFVAVRDVAFEGDLAWVSNVSGRPLHVFDGASWSGYPYPPGIPASTEALRLAIDDFGQKWLALGGSGLGVWDTGDPATSSDDRALRFTNATGNGTGLPDAEVRDVVVDADGRVWLGTARGIAYVFSPGSAFSGDGSLATPQWPITADGTDFLLRDVEVYDLEVDPAGQIWVATSSGAYLVSASGDAVVRTVTAETSPLPSDAVFTIGVDPRSGRVYFVTAEGLFSGPGDATRPSLGAEALAVAPSPFRPSQGADGVVVTGLSAPVSQIRVLTVAGDVVYAAEVRGGSFRWSGRDAAGVPVRSGVYLVAASGSDGSTRFGKVAVLR